MSFRRILNFFRHLFSQHRVFFSLLFILFMGIFILIGYTAIQQHRVYQSRATHNVMRSITRLRLFCFVNTDLNFPNTTYLKAEWEDIVPYSIFVMVNRRGFPTLYEIDDSPVLRGKHYSRTYDPDSQGGVDFTVTLRNKERAIVLPGGEKYLLEKGTVIDTQHIRCSSEKNEKLNIPSPDKDTINNDNQYIGKSCILNSGASGKCQYVDNCINEEPGHCPGSSRVQCCPQEITVSVKITGRGRVTDKEGKINCTTRGEGVKHCEKTVNYNGGYELHATPAAGFKFEKWNPAKWCNAPDTTKCKSSGVKEDRTITAIFEE